MNETRFNELAGQGFNRIPVTREVLADTGVPADGKTRVDLRGQVTPLDDEKVHSVRERRRLHGRDAEDFIRCELRNLRAIERRTFRA